MPVADPGESTERQRRFRLAVALLVAGTLAAAVVAESADGDHQGSWFTLLLFLAIGVATLVRLARAAASQRLLPVVMGAFSIGFVAQFVLAYVFFAGALGGCDAQTSWIDGASTQLWFVQLGALGLYGLVALSLWTTRERNNTARNTWVLLVPAWIGVSTFVAIILLVDYDNCGVFV